MKDIDFAHTAFSGEVYERGRYGYSHEAVAYLLSTLGIGAGTRVVDLAAGTGKLTRLLVPSGATVLAVEPVASMRQQLAVMVPGALPIAGTAEAIPVRSGSLDAVTVAQAFHWFQPERALPELHRVLRPQGRLGLIWNRADTSVDWVARLSALSLPRRPTSGRTIARKFRKRLARRLRAPAATGPGDAGGWLARSGAALESSAMFGPPETRMFRHSEDTDGERLVDWVRSFSKFSSLGSAEQRQVVHQIQELTAGLPRRIEFPFCSDVLWCAKR